MQIAQPETNQKLESIPDNYFALWDSKIPTPNIPEKNQFIINKINEPYQKPKRIPKPKKVPTKKYKPKQQVDVIEIDANNKIENFLGTGKQATLTLVNYTEQDIMIAANNNNSTFVRPKQKRTSRKQFFIPFPAELVVQLHHLKIETQVSAIKQVLGNEEFSCVEDAASVLMDMFHNINSNT